MPEFKIMRWDPVIVGNNNEPFPMFYIKPEGDFAEYIKKNDYIFLVTVDETGMDYDKRSVKGIVSNTLHYPNYRPNFFNETGYYSVTLFTNWIGYPGNNGKVMLQGAIEGPDKIEMVEQPKFEVPKPVVSEFYGEEDCKKMNMRGLLIIFLIFVVMFMKK